LAVAGRSQAADPQTYSVEFSAGERALEQALRASSDLEALRRNSEVSAFALVLRARQDVERLRQVLDSAGYYGARIDITLDGHSLDEPELATMLEAVPTGQEVRVRVAVDRGPLYHVREVRIDGALPESARTELGVASGMPAVAADALAARDRVLASLQQQGYAFASADTPIAYVDGREPLIDLEFPVVAGAPVTLGELRLQGLGRTHEAIVRSRIRVQPGERYDPRVLERARRDLLALGVFSGVSVGLPAADDDSHQAPVTFQFTERKRHAVKLTADYSTDLGTDAGITWTDRNVWGNAEQLELGANAMNLGGKATRAVGYDVQANLVRPDPRRSERTQRYSASAIKQSLQAYDVQSVTLGAQLEQRYSEWWTGSAGLQLRRSRITQQGQDYNYLLLSLPLAARYDNTRQGNPLLDPVRGMRAAILLSPAQALDQPRRALLITQASVAAYVDFTRGGDAGRTVLAARGIIGNVYGASQFRLPPDQRFYAGGSATVRGYRYQSIGPQFADGTPAGGTTLAAAGVELRQRIGQRFGAALFVDTGQVTASKLPFNGTWSVGAGAGLRVYTPIGPVRIDLAVPVSPSPGADRFQLYIGLGQAF
jgi:translocation and assembly module TamA